ncbi:MAG: cation-translocating P-type ATPase [Bacteriovoracaceae bacterium]|nr:cation-translocating P-type ATPase [Bacteriovoracaceae bacterium]
MKEVKEPWALSADEVSRLLDTNAITGLADAKVTARYTTHGSNTLKAQKKVSNFKRFSQQIESPVVVILIIASIVSGALGEVTDALAIIIIVVINAIIGFVQESKAESAIEALKNMSTPKARVIRAGLIKECEASEVTIGDILLLESGDYVAADSRLILANQLSVDESVLTGESLPVNKTVQALEKSSILAERKNMLFASTAVATGSAKAIVTSIGMQTEIGKIAGLLESAHMVKTPLQTKLELVSKKLLYLCSGVVILVAILGKIHGEPWLDVFMNAISLAVAAIPEGLPAVVTVALALAVRRMSKKNAIVRHLPAVETLGSTSVICTDKTGTLTTGKMRVRDIFPYEGKESALIESGMLCSNASLSGNGQSTGDPTEVALLYLGKDHQIEFIPLASKYPRLYEWSFDSNRKRMSVAVKDGDATRIHCKGAPESILEISNLDGEQKSRIRQQILELSSKGYRLLGVGDRCITGFKVEDFKDSDLVERDLNFLGIIAISDPPRSETIPAIKTCKESGIKIVMITGDHPVTAKAIGKELGIVEEGIFDGVLTGPELDKLSSEQLSERVENIAVYARVTPEHKLKIVEAWQSRGNVVAMTGDGVNDAPALKKASIGVAMGKGGTEVAKQASSMILTDDNFSTIVSAVEEGRAIFGNIRRTIQYLLSGNLSEILIMLGAALMGWPAPLAPVHLLWINLVTDGFPSLALAAEPVPKDVLKGMAPSSKTFFDKIFYQEMILIGSISALLVLALYGYMLRTTDELTARTYAFSFLVFVELFRSFASRSETKTFFEMGVTSNVYHLIAVAIPISFQIFLHHSGYFLEVFKVTHLSWTSCLGMVAITLIPVTFLEMRKMLKKKSSNLRSEEAYDR